MYTHSLLPPSFRAAFFGFADAALLSAFLELKKLAVTRGRLCILQSIRSLSYYEIRVQPDCGHL